MTRPASELQWSPDLIHHLGVWGRWFGAPWNYRLDWGDGETTNMAHSQSSVRHLYPRPGTYTLTATPDLPGGTPVAATVTVRERLRPHALFTQEPPGNVIGCALDPIPDPVRYRVDWGDGDVTVHGAGDPTPLHTYPWGYGVPQVTVTDVPSRRTGRFTAPEIGPEPEPDLPVPEWTFHHTYLPPEYTDHPDQMRGEFRGRNLRPGVKYRVRMSWTENPDNYATATARPDGTATAPIPPGDPACWTVGSGKWYYPWRVCVAYEDSDPADTYAYIPITSKQDGLNPDGPTVCYMFAPDNQFRYQVQVQAPAAGVYEVDWGDGDKETVGCDGDVFCLWHTYDTSLYSSVVTVTGPDGRKGTVKLGFASLVEPYCYRVDDILGSAVRTYLEYPHGDTARTPMVVRWRDDGNGGERLSDGIPGAVYPWQKSGVYAASHWYRREWWGKTTTISVYGPQRHRSDFDMTIPDRLPPTKYRPEPPEPPVLPNGDVNPFYRDPVTCWFGDVEEWDGGYRGVFHVANNTGQTVPAWTVEFELADPAVLREVWPSTASFTDLGGGRWRITGHTPIPPGGDVTVGARVEPPGKTRKWPDQITAREVA